MIGNQGIICLEPVLISITLGKGQGGEVGIRGHETLNANGLLAPNRSRYMIWNLLILTVAVFIVANILPGIQIKNVFTALVVALVYSIVSFFMGWLLVFLTLPFMIITFGLFKLVINAFLLFITDKLIDDFKIKDGLTTLIAALLITLVDSGLHLLF